MQVIDLEGNGQVRAGRTEIDVSYIVKTTFVLPLHGPDLHSKVMEPIDSQKLLRPTTAQVLAFVDFAQQNRDEPHCAGILNRFKEGYLWTGTENLSFPDGVLVYDNVDGKMPSKRNALLKLAKSGDNRVRLVGQGFKTGFMSIEDALANPYTIAQIGKNMLPIFKRVAKRLDEKNIFVGFWSTDLDTKTTVYSDNGTLGLDGRHDGKVYGYGYAFGVLE